MHEDLDFVTTEEHAVFVERLLESHPQGLEKTELLRQFQVARDWLNRARIDIALWENVRDGKVCIRVDADGELVFMRK